MAAYVITDVEITDSALYGKFLEKVTATVESHGGKFVARGGSIDVILATGGGHASHCSISAA